MAASRDLGEFIRELRKNARISLRQLADQAGVSNPYLSQIERGLRKPSAEVLQQLANALRVSTPLMYLRAGLLAEREGQGVAAAIAADPDLTDRHKKTLVEIYEAFRRENARTSGEPISDPDAEHSDTRSTPEPDATSIPDTEAASEVASEASGQAAERQTVKKAATRVSQSSRNGRASQAPRAGAARKSSGKSAAKSAGKSARKATTGDVDQPATRPKKEKS